VQNHAFEKKNSKWKECWQIVHEFTKEHIQDNMELAHFDEQSYQLELHAYQTTFPNFKYKPFNCIFVEIRTNSRVLATPFLVQPIAITKPISPLRGGTCLKIIPLHVQTFAILIAATNVVNEHVVDNKKSNKEHVEHINPSFTILYNRLESLKFLFASLPLTPH